MFHNRIVLSLAAAAIAVFTTACGVDNSGGPIPAGDQVGYRVIGTTGEIGGVDDAAFVTAENIADEVLCRSFIDDEPHAFCQDSLEQLQEGERLVLVSVQLGGCLDTGYGVQGAYLDDDQLNTHLLKADYSIGNPGMGCTDDLQAEAHAVAVTGADDASVVELTVGTFNPDLLFGPIENVPVETTE